MKQPNMIVENADLSFARETLRSFMDSVALARALHDITPRPYSLTVAQRAAFDTAVISWCILFGSHHAENQALHWKNMFDADQFRAGLVEALGISLEEWRAYRQDVVDYRNELAAHRDLNPKTRFHPNFDKAIIAADLYYHWLCQKVLVTIGADTEGDTLIQQLEHRLEVFTRQMRVAAEVVSDQ